MNSSFLFSFHILRLLFVVSAVGGCASTPYDPFKVSKEEIRTQMRVVALAPIHVSNSVFDSAKARARFEVPVVSRLEVAGLRVVESSVWETLWLQFGGDVGELYDASTGQVDKERYNIVREAVYRGLESDYDVDAILYLSISTVDLYLVDSSEADFCGGQGEVYWPGAWSGTFYFFDPATMVVAACLQASVVSLDRQVLYGIRAPLEVVETYARQTRSVRPKEERFVDDARIEAAIAATIGPIADNARRPN